MTGLRHKVVLASAGTGKTWQLTERFEQLLRADVPPERILATTFTRLAAGQILDRVLDRLARAAGEDAALLPLLGRLLRQLDQFQVMTLDAVFLRLLATLGPLSGLGAGFTMAEDWDDQRLREDAVERALEDVATAELWSLLRSLVRSEMRRSVHATLLGVIDSGWSAWLDSEASAWRWLRPPPAPDAAAAARDCAELEEAELPRTKAGGPNKVWVNARGRIVTALQNGDWEGICADTLIRAALAGEEFARWRAEGPILDLLQRVASLARARALVEMAEENAARHALLTRFAGHYRELQRERGLYRFDDLPWMLRDVRDGAGAAALARATAGIEHLLLDEFQDTSVAQWLALRPLARAILGEPEAGRRTLLCVGDLKQSIYGWRSGEPRLLARMAQAAEVGEPFRLTTSRRCSPEVLAAVNSVFGSLADNPVWQVEAHKRLRPDAVSWQEAFAPHSAHEPRRGRAILRAAPAAGEDEPQELLTLRCAAERVSELHKAAPWASIGVLVRRGKWTPRLLYELQALGVRASGEGGSPLVDSAAVLVALSLLHLADHPKDGPAWFHVTTSPISAALRALDKDRGAQGALPFARAVRQRLLREGCGAVLQELLPAVHACESFDSWDRGRFAQLLELLWRLDERPGLRLSDIVRRIRVEKVESPRPCAVQVMTVHAAKGLEFHAVVLADLGSGWFRKLQELWTSRPDPEGPLTRVQGYVRSPLQGLDPRLGELALENQGRMLRECLCVLYVAMTRAIHHLEMVVPPQRGGNELSDARILRGALAPSAEDTGVLWAIGEDSDWERHPPDRPPARPAPLPVPLRLLPAAAPRGVRVSPSRLARGLGGDAREALRLGDSGARRHGILVHRLLQEVEWLEGFRRTDAELLALLRPLGSAGEGKDAVATLRKALDGEASRAVMARGAFPAAARVQVWRERRFLVPRPEGLLQGSFDRVVVVHGAAGPVSATVVDFKTDVVRDQAHEDQLVVQYAPQLLAYRHAVAALTGLLPEAVAGRLWFLASGQLL